MGAHLSTSFDGDGVSITIPAGYQTPSWPSLYIPTLSSTNQQRGVYLYEAEVIWRFTLYWTLLLLCGIFFLTALLAAFTLLLSLLVFRNDELHPGPDSRSKSRPRARSDGKAKAEPTEPSTPGHIPQTPNPSSPNPDPTNKQTPHPHSHPHPTPATPSTEPLLPPQSRPKRKRPPLWPVFLLPFFMAGVAAVISLITGTVVGFALAAIYSAGGFLMSTWVPFIWALIQVLVLIISSYSTLTSIL